MKIKINKRKLPLITLFSFGFIILFMAICNHYFYRTVTYDYGVYNFAFWDYSHFRISQSTLTVGTFLQDHYSFTLMYFVPVFWLLNWLTGSYTLILIQSTMILVAAWYSYKLIMLKSKDNWLGTGTLILYFVIFARYTTMSCDCNLAVIAACMIPIFLYYFEMRRYVVAGIIFILALFSRENIPIWFIFIFIVLMIEHRKDRKVVLINAVGILISVLYFIVLFKLLIPSIETAGRQYTLFNYSALGANPSDAISFILHHPLDSLKILFTNHLHNPAYDGIKAEFYWVYFLSGGFILFLRPKYLIWFIPLIAQKELNDSIIRWGISNYYSIEIATLMPLAAFLVLTEIKNKYIKYGLAVIACAVTLYVTLYKLEPKHLKIEWTSNPAKERIWDKDFFKAPFHLTKVNKLLALIPPDAVVSSSDKILTHISQRQFIYLFPEVKDAEYIVFSVSIDNWLHSHEVNDQRRNLYLSSAEWEIVAKEYPVVLLRKRHQTMEINNRINQVNANAVTCNVENIDEIKKRILFSNLQKSDSLNIRTGEMAHSGSYSLKLTKDAPYGMLYLDKAIDRVNFIEASVWRFSKENQGEIIASCGKDFYQSSNRVIDKDSTGWEKLQLQFLVPDGLNAIDFRIYVNNPGPDPIYIDDFSIKKF